MIIFRFDASLWALVMVPAFLAACYVTWRGIVRQEFREPAKKGWFRYDTNEPEYWGGLAINILLLCCFAFLAFESLFNWSRY
jgi:hypothetical protein